MSFRDFWGLFKPVLPRYIITWIGLSILGLAGANWMIAFFACTSLWKVFYYKKGWSAAFKAIFSLGVLYLSLKLVLWNPWTFVFITIVGVAAILYYNWTGYIAMIELVQKQVWGDTFKNLKSKGLGRPPIKLVWWSRRQVPDDHDKEEHERNDHSYPSNEPGESE